MMDNDTTKPKIVNSAEAAPLSLINHTLSRTNQVVSCLRGSFVKPKCSNLVTADPHGLTLYTVLPGGKLQQVSEQRFFTGIRAVAHIPCKDPHHVDYVAITTDSGYVQALQYFPANVQKGPVEAGAGHGSAMVDPVELSNMPRAVGRWEVVASMLLGKSGAKRSVPGHYLSVDPDGHCLFVGALERHKVIIPIEQRFAPDIEGGYASLTPDAGGQSGGIQTEEMEGAPLDFKVGAAQVSNTESARLRRTKESAQRISFGSPLEAHKSVVLQAVVALDHGAEDLNPTFACLELSAADVTGSSEVDHENASVTKIVAYYSYDPGLRHVMRVWSTQVNITANTLIALPGGGSCPGGVLVCGESELQWVHNHVLPPMVAAQHPPFPSAVIPGRSSVFPGSDFDSACSGLLVVGSGSLRFKEDYFLLVQDEVGDMFRVRLDRPEQGTPSAPHGWGVTIRYFDSIPVASGGLCVCMVKKKGYLTSFSESGDYFVHQVAGDGEETDEYISETRFVALRDGGFRAQPLFNPNPAPKYLLQTDTVQHLGPLVSALYVPREPAVEGLRSANGGYLVAVSGRGPASAFCRLKYGKSVQTAGNPYKFPGGFSKLLAVATNGGKTNRLIVTTIAQGQGGSMFYDTSNVDGVTGDPQATELFVQNASTLAAAELRGGGFIQVTPDKMRLVPSQGERRDWEHPIGKKIVAAAVNANQMVLCFSHDMALYFVMNPQDGRPAKQGSEVMVRDAFTLIFPPTDADSMAPFMGIVTRRSLEVNVFQPPGEDKPFKALESKGTLRLDDKELGLEITSAAYFQSSDGATLSLLVGQTNGVFLRLKCDKRTGTLQSLNEFNCGENRFPCKVLPPCPGSGRAFVLGDDQVLVCRHEEGGMFVQDPVINEGLARNTDLVEVLDQHTKEYHLLGLQGEMFYVYHVPQSISTGSASTSRYVREAEKKLDVQCKRMSIVHLIQGTVGVLLGAEYRCAPYQMGQSERVTGVPTVGQRVDTVSQKTVMEHASVLQVVDLSGKGKEWPAVPLLAPDVALCLDYGVFPSMGHDPVVVVGTAKNYQPSPMKHDGGAVMVYHFSLVDQNSVNPSMVQTAGAGPRSMQMPLQLAGDPNPIVDDIPLSVHCFRGGVLVGHAGRTHGVQFFEWGGPSKKLLFKGKLAIFEGPIVSIASRGDFVAIGDSIGGVFFCKHEQRPGKSKNGLSLLADEAQPRRVVNLCFLDEFTVAVSDKFGTITCLRLPPNCPTSRPSDFGDECFGMAALDLPKLCTVSNFYTGGLVNALTPLRLTADVEPSRRGVGGVPATSTIPADGLLYSTMSGTIGTLLPFKTDAEFTHMYHFSAAMRRKMDPSRCQNTSSIIPLAEGESTNTVALQPLHRGVGLDHYAHRSKFTAGTGVIDGDLLDAFFKLTTEEQISIEKEVKKELKQVNKLFEERGDKKRNFSETCANRYVEMREVVTKL